MARLRVSLLGSYEVELDGKPVTGFTSDKVRALLAYLSTEAGRPHRRETLAGLLWPDWPERSARANLRNTLYNLRKVLGDLGTTPTGREASSFLIITRQTVEFNAASDHRIDVAAFQHLVDARPVNEAILHQLEEAVGLYRGPFLEGFSLADSPIFEEWALAARERLQRQVLAALQRLLSTYEEQGDLARACQFAWRQVELAPWNEQAHQALMRALAASGQRGAALAQYETCWRVLKEELDFEPGEETQRLYQRIRSGDLGRSHRHPGRISEPGLQPPLYERIRDGEPAPPGPPSWEAGGAQDVGTFSVARGTEIDHRPPPSQQVAPTPPGAPLPGAGREAAEGGTPGGLEGERRVVTVLFADVKGSTALAGQIDTEDWVEVMSGTLQILSAEIQRYGGQVDRYEGDGLVAFFGLAAAHENDAERAVLTALAMQEAVQRYAEGLAARQGADTEHPIELLLRVGLATGEVIATHVGEAFQHGEATAMGRTIALAARLEPAAEPGTVLVGENTYRLVERAFEWQTMEGIAAKGYSEPLTAYRPLKHKAMPGKGRGIEGLSSPLVGRDAELHALQDVIAALGDGIGGIVTVVGEAGIGKSRLVAQVRASPNLKSPADPRSGLTWLEGRCLSYSTDVAYHLWQDLLRTWLDVTPDAPPLTVRDTLRERVRALCGEGADQVYPYLGRLLALPLENEIEDRLRGLDGASLQFITFRAVETLLERAAGERPLAVVCEDLHWADASSLALLEQLLSVTDRVPLLTICVLRPERAHRCWQIVEAAAREYAHSHTNLTLEPLSQAASATLVGNLLRIEDLSEGVRARILEHAEGNPFFVEEILRSLIDAAAEGGAGIAYDESSGRWQATGDVRDIPIPDTLHGVLQARIDRLPAEPKRLLQLASVIGRDFSHPVLSAVYSPLQAPRLGGGGRGAPTVFGRRGEGGESLDAHLITLQRAQLIRQRRRTPAREYAFKHHLTQEAAYGTLLRRERRATHRRIAEALETLYPDRIEEQLGLLAHHWERAGEIERAVGYLQRAGEQAAAQYANDEAIGFLTRALEWVPERTEVGSNPEAIERRYALLLAREAIYDMQGKREAQRRDLEALAALVEAGAQDGQKAAVAARQARYATVTYDHPRAMAMAQEAVRLARAAGDPACEAAGERQWAWVCWRLYDHEAARLHAERAVSLARGAGLRQEEARCLNILGTVVRHTPHSLAAARAYYERALHIYRQLGDLRGEGEVLHELGFVVGMQGDYDQLAVHFERVLRIYREIGNRQGEIWAARVLGTRCAHVGDYVAAKSYYEQTLRIAREMGDLFFESETLCRLGRLAWKLGDYAAARSYLERALRIARDTGKPVPGSPLTTLALIWHSLGDDEAAYGYACQEPLLRDRVFSGDREIVLGHALLGLGRPGEAADAYRQALDIQQEGERHHLTAEPTAGLARVALAQGDHVQAETHVKEILYQLHLHPKLEGTLEPLRIYLTCYQVLHAVDDPRAQEVLEAAHRLLQQRAGGIDDETLRRSFLENVPAHREIIAAWQEAPHP